MHKLTGEMVDVAVKTNPYEDPDETEDFEREMAISADPEMNHPNIVKVYGLIKEGEVLKYNCILRSSLNCGIKHFTAVAGIGY